MTPPIYLDNNATTRVDPAVLAAMLPFFGEHYGNPSSKHALGETAARAVATARADVRRLVGAARDTEIVFTSGGTESNNLALHAALAARSGRNEIVTSQVEHPAILAVCEELEKTGRAIVHRIGVDADGRLDVEAYRRALGPRVACVSLMWANNETGVVFPVRALASLAHEVGALFHTDAVQATGKIPLDVAESEIDLLSLSAHKFHGPKGVGVLYVRHGLVLQPLVRGGRQERGRRAGTENVPAIVGLGFAAALALAALDDEMARVGSLRDRLEAGLLARVQGARVLGDPRARVPGTLCIAFENVESDAILVLLERRDIVAASGSACASGSMEPSHVVRALHVPFSHAHGAVRFSLSRETTASEIDRVLDVLPEIVASVRFAEPSFAGSYA